MNVQIAETFYVDASRGDDANSGRSPDRPWRTLAQVNSADLQPGATVLFRRGETWRGQLVTKRSNATGWITYGAYGEGPKPLLLGSVARNDPSDWRDEGGNIWSTPTVDTVETIGPELLGNPSFDTTSAGWNLHAESGATVSGGRDTTMFDTAPAGYAVRVTQPGTASNHVQLYVMNLPVQRDRCYLLSFRARATQPFTVPNIAFLKSTSPWTPYGELALGTSPTIGTDWATHRVVWQANATANDARITLALGGAVPAGATVYLDSLSFRECDSRGVLLADVGNLVFDGERSAGVKVWDRASLDRQGRYWYEKTTGSLKLYSAGNPALRYTSIECALRRHIIWMPTSSYVRIEGLDLRYGGAHGISATTGTNHVIVRDCDFSWIGGSEQSNRVRYGNGVEFWDAANDVIVEGNRFHEIYDAAMTPQGNSGPGFRNLYFRNNLVTNTEYCFEYWNRPETSVTRNVWFENNTCINSGGGWGHAQRPDPSGRDVCIYLSSADTRDLFIRRNLFIGAWYASIWMRGPFNGLATTYIDSNLYWGPRGHAVYWLGTVYKRGELAKYQAATGQDAHSLEADPLFVSAGAGDFRLSQLAAGQGLQSPAVDADAEAAAASCVDLAGELLCMDRVSTASDSRPDRGPLDWGWHR